jgi:hypothetical protein
MEINFNLGMLQGGIVEFASRDVHSCDHNDSFIRSQHVAHTCVLGTPT